MEDNQSITEEGGKFKVITRRPDEMAYADYKTYMRAQKKAIKRYLKGSLFHLSKLHPTQTVLSMLAEEEYKDMRILLTRGLTYIKPKNEDTKE